MHTHVLGSLASWLGFSFQNSLLQAASPLLLGSPARPGPSLNSPSWHEFSDRVWASCSSAASPKSLRRGQYSSAGRVCVLLREHGAYRTFPEPGQAGLLASALVTVATGQTLASCSFRPRGLSPGDCPSLK